MTPHGLYFPHDLTLGSIGRVGSAWGEWAYNFLFVHKLTAWATWACRERFHPALHETLEAAMAWVRKARADRKKGPSAKVRCLGIGPTQIYKGPRDTCHLRCHCHAVFDIGLATVGNGH